MSFDIFLAVFSDDEALWFDRTIAERAFAEIVPDLSGDHWGLRTPDGEDCWATILINDKLRINGLSVNRPPAFDFPEFWNALFEVLRRTHTILFWPSDGPHPNYCIGNPVLIADAPQDLIESMGEPAIVSSGAEIEAAVLISCR